MQVGVGGLYKTIINPYVGVSGVWKTVTDGWVGHNGVWTPIFSHMSPSVAFTVLINPSSVTGQTTLKNRGDTPEVTATPMNGTGPYTYAWAKVDGPTGIYCSSPTSRLVSFYGTIRQGNDIENTWGCTVTDAMGRVAMGQVDVNVLSSANRN